MALPDLLTLGGEVVFPAFADALFDVGMGVGPVGAFVGGIVGVVGTEVGRFVGVPVGGSVGCAVGVVAWLVGGVVGGVVGGGGAAADLPDFPPFLFVAVVVAIRTSNLSSRRSFRSIRASNFSSCSSRRSFRFSSLSARRSSRVSSCLRVRRSNILFHFVSDETVTFLALLSGSCAITEMLTIVARDNARTAELILIVSVFVRCSVDQ